MRIVLAATSAFALAMTAPVLAQHNGQGNGHGNGPSKAKPDKRQGNGNGRGSGNADSLRGGPPQNRGDANGRGNIPELERVRGRVDERIDDARSIVKGARRDVERRVEDEVRRGTSRAVDAVASDDARSIFERFAGRDRNMRGFCPPGLAKKHNGCQPPGQSKKLNDDRLGGYFGAMDARLEGDDWRRYDGYAYREDGGGLIDALIPLVGGALFRGKQWPSAYDSYRAPTYYGDYFGGSGSNQYYYADRTLFSVDPRDQAITGIAALLTGDDISVGDEMPSGYDVYNVPYAYRDRYRDGADANYRYSDGYVYQIDPQTRVVAAVIELLS